MTRLGALDADRAGYWATWRDLAAHFAPRRGRFLASANDSTRGRRKDQRIIDNTPLLAARVLGSGMMAGISSPARPWFRLRLADDAATEQDGKAGFSKGTKILPQQVKIIRSPNLP